MYPYLTSKLAYEPSSTGTFNIPKASIVRFLPARGGLGVKLMYLISIRSSEGEREQISTGDWPGTLVESRGVMKGSCWAPGGW